MNTIMISSFAEVVDRERGRFERNPIDESNGEKIDMGIEDGASANQSSERRMSEGDVETMEEDISGATKSTNGNTSEEDMSTEMKDKKEKRKLQEDGVESEQNEYIETAIEVKKKNKSISTSDV
ncbi:uncharacterized protein LOC113338389 isoform X1 [Papaver somniferum]|uniref:uncharacterized protein LOC113338389 isoform X1 n=1 Tax=Papaver somniferum TaxID=3469 RepID=UPI000E6FBFB1|nr:uncharacterized protein LOC113338389 isoform X1 [Papaver somniferum]